MTRDEFLTEWLGECWHDLGDTIEVFWEEGAPPRCRKCNKEWDGVYLNDWPNWDFSTWPGFGKLWEKAIQDEDAFRKFNDECFYIIERKRINPDRFATEWAESLGWEEEKQP